MENRFSSPGNATTRMKTELAGLAGLAGENTCPTYSKNPPERVVSRLQQGRVANPPRPSLPNAGLLGTSPQAASLPHSAIGVCRP